jgi:hypothetical protein
MRLLKPPQLNDSDTVGVISQSFPQADLRVYQRILCEVTLKSEKRLSNVEV